MRASDGTVRRVVLAAGTQTYQGGSTFSSPLDNLDAVPGELQAVVETLCWLGYEPEGGSARPFLLDPDVRTLQDSMQSVARSADVAVVYYSGHALKPDRSPYYLLTTESVADDLNRTALQANGVPTLLQRRVNEHPSTEQPAVLVILDCCYSGAGGADVLRETLQNRGNEHVWVLAAAWDEHEAQQGLFAKAFTSALTQPNAGHVADYIRPDAVHEHIDKWLADHGATQRSVLFPPRGQHLGPTPPFFPNPNKISGAAGLTLVEQRLWNLKLQGAPENSSATGSYLSGTSGRINAIEDISTWMRSSDKNGLALVTGSPGSGKSTLVTLPTLLAAIDDATEHFMADLPKDSLLGRAAQLFEGLPLSGLSARGKNLYEIAETIADRLDVGVRTYDDLLEILSSQLEAPSRVLVVDAADEAVDPRRLLLDLLIPLSRRPGLKVLIAARKNLLPALGDAALIVDLDTDRYRDPQALVSFACQLLVASREPGVTTPYVDAPAAVTLAVAQAIAARATAAPSPAGQAESFLLAQLLARSLRSREKVAVPANDGWGAQLPLDIDSAFNEDLARLGHRESKVTALLRALAWAHGPGLPFELWCPIALALTAADASALLLDATDAKWLIENAGGYITEDLGPGETSVYRPYHNLLTTYLRGERAGVGGSPISPHGRPSESERAETAITLALLDTVPIGPGGFRDWERAHPYLRTYLARHAYAAGEQTFSLLLGDPDYLAVADPVTLTPLLDPANSSTPSVARAYRRARPLLGNNPGDNAAYIAESLSIEACGVKRQDISPTYETALARMTTDNSLLTFTGHQGPVSSLVFGTGVDGRSILASGGWDGNVRLWDTGTGSQPYAPLNHGDSVSVVAICGKPTGGLMLVSASGDGMVRFWDIVTGTQISETLLEFPYRGAAMAIGTTSNGDLVLASGGVQGGLQLWQLATGFLLDEHLSGHGAFVESVAFGTRSDGRLILASASADGTTYIWDSDTDLRYRSTIDHGGRVSSVAFSTGRDRQLTLATAGWEGTIRMWEALTGSPVGERLVGNGGPVSTVAFGTGAKGKEVLASAERGDALRLWDTGTVPPTSESFLGLGTGAQSLAFGRDMKGESLLASGGGDGTVRLWNPDTGTTADTRLIGHRGPVDSLSWAADTGGRTILASGGFDGTVRLWDTANGASVGIPFASNGDKVDTVTLGNGPGGKLYMASASGSGTIWLWDPKTGSGVALGSHLGGVESLSFGTGTGGRWLLASGGLNGSVHIWDPDAGTRYGQSLEGHHGPISTLAFNTRMDGQPLLISAGWDGIVRLWDLSTDSEFREVLFKHARRVLAAAFTTSVGGVQTLVTACDDGSVWLWDSDTAAQIGEVQACDSPLVAASFGTTLSGNLIGAFAGADSSIRVWDTHTRHTLATVQRRTPARSVVIIGDSLGIGDDEGVFVLRLQRQLLNPFSG